MGIVKLKSTSTTTHEPKQTTRTEYEVNGFTNPDGTPNEAAYREFEEGKRQMASAYHVDPNTGRVDNKHLSDILHFDPEITRRKREEEEALNRRKQKESAFYNALAVLGDMVTTAGGGNVWQRKADQHAIEAHDANLALQREQQAEDAAIGAKAASTEQEYAKAVQKLRETIGKAYGAKVSTSREQGGKSTTTANREEQERKYLYGQGGAGRSGGSSSASREKYMNVKLKGGEQKRYSLQPNQYAAVVNLLRGHYDDILHRGNADNATEQERRAAEDLQRDLIRVGALEKSTDAMSNKAIQYRLKDDMLLQSGEYFQLTPAIRKRLEEETGGKIRFVTGQQKQQTAQPQAGRLSRNPRASR